MLREPGLELGIVFEAIAKQLLDDIVRAAFGKLTVTRQQLEEVRIDPNVELLLFGGIVSFAINGIVCLLPRPKCQAKQSCYSCCYQNFYQSC